jgi:hypothetical protein
MIDREQQLAVYRAQTENVRALGKAWTQVERAINEALRKDNRDVAGGLTKCLALVFSAWAESNFSKIIHTPYGFELDEIEQIKNTWSQSGIGEGWKTALEVALRKAPSRGKSNYLPNIRLTITRIIELYAIAPSLVRNKLAHGQWAITLNRENTRVNQDLTLTVCNIDCVQVDRWREAHRILAEMMETLIESPERAFHRDYWGAIARLETELVRRETWTIDTKLARLRPKPVLSRQNGSAAASSGG